MIGNDQRTTSPYPETRITVWAKSLGALLVGVASVIVSWTAVNVQRSLADSQKANSLQDLAIKQKMYEHQRDLDAAHLAVTLIPFIKCNDDLQRASALELLSKDAPSHGVIFGDLLLRKCANLPTLQRNEVTRIKERSRVQQDADEFFLRLDNAREYKDKGHDGPAARLFEEARERLPQRYSSKVNREELDKAKRAFDEGRFTEAADRFVMAFRAIPDAL